jgi:predicted nucleotidyltransferase
MSTGDGLQHDIEMAARILREVGAREVFVFGSASREEPPAGCDLDLAVRGLPPERFFDAMSRVALAISRPLDLVDLDERNPFTEYLERKGELRRVA